MLFRPPLFLPFFLISLSFLAVVFLSFAPFNTFAFPISGFLPEIQLGSLRSTVSSPSGPGRSQLNTRFLVHFELENHALVMVLLHTFSNNHACIVIRTGRATYRYGLYQKRSDSMAYRPTSSPAVIISQCAGVVADGLA